MATHTYGTRSKTCERRTNEMSSAPPLPHLDCPLLQKVTNSSFTTLAGISLMSFRSMQGRVAAGFPVPPTQALRFVRCTTILQRSLRLPTWIISS